MFHKIAHILKIAAIVLIALALAGALVLQSSFVQSKMAGKATQLITEKIDGRLEIGNMHFLLGTVILSDVVVIDGHPHSLAPTDTLFSAGYICARMTPQTIKNLRLYLSGERDIPMISLESVRVKNLRFNLVIEGQEENNLMRVFSLKKAEFGKPYEQEPEIFHIRKAKVEHSAYTMVNTMRIPLDKFHPKTEMALNYDNLWVEDINATASDVRFSDKVFYCDDAVATMKDHFSGHRIDRVAASTVRVGRGLTDVRDFAIKDRFTDTVVENYQMRYANPLSFADYIHKVEMYGLFRKARVNMKTISFFATGFTALDFDAVLDGEAEGTLSDFRIDASADIFPSGKSQKVMDVKVNGKVDIEEDPRKMSFDATASAGSVSTAELSDIFRLEAVEKFAKGMSFAPTVILKGDFHDLKADVSILDESDPQAPVVDLSANVLEVLSAEDRNISLALSCENLDLGKIIEAGSLGEISLDLEASGPIDDLTISDLSVSKVEFNGYNYSGISAKGRVKNTSLYEGVISIDDPNVRFDFNGIVGLQGFDKKKFSIRDLVYDFTASAPLVDLKATNLTPGGKIWAVSIPTISAEKNTTGSKYVSRIGLNDISITDPESVHDFGSVLFTAYSTSERYAASLTSEIADATYTGDLDKTFADIRNAVINRHFPGSLANGPYREALDESYKFSLVFKDGIIPLLGYFTEGAYIENGSTVDVSLTKDNTFDFSFASKRLALKTNYIKNARLRMNSDKFGVTANLFCNTLHIADQDLENDFISISAQNDTVFAGIGFRDNENSFGAVNARAALMRIPSSGKIGADIQMSETYLCSQHDYWMIHPAHITLGDNDFRIENLHITSTGGDDLFISGTKSENLKIDIGSFNISSLEKLAGIHLGGVAKGTADLRLSTDSDDFIDADLLISDVVLDKAEAGNVSVKGSFNKAEKVAEAILTNTSAEGTPLWAVLNYSLDSGQADGQVVLNKFNIAQAAPFIGSYVSDLRGTASGDLELRIDRDGFLNIYKGGALTLDGVHFKVVPTGVTYDASGKVLSEGNGLLRVDALDVKDLNGGSARITGDIDISDFNDIHLKADASVRDLQCISLAAGENTLSGEVYADCDAHIEGPVSAMVVDGQASISRPSNVELSLWGNTSKSAASMLTFKSAEGEEEPDPYELMLARIRNVKKKAQSGITANLVFKATDDLTAKASFMEGGASYAQIRGNGDISLNLDSKKGTFDTHGDYTISEGKVSVNVAVAREFIIDEGSAIHINTPVMSTDLDIRAIYKTKANVSTLIADTTSVSQRRNVNCIISLSDRISDPKIGLAIDIPDLDPTVKSQVETALNTEDKIQRQFASLLISNNFMPNEESGIVNNNNNSLVFSGASQILANQFNRILDYLDIPLDLGLNYQPSQNGGKDLFDVAISTQLFNNRVEVGGQLSNSSYESTGDNSLLGDVDVEVKIDRKGALRVKGFSHSADKYTIYLDNSQRNGIGVSYQKEFNTFRELWDDLFKKQKRTR